MKKAQSLSINTVVVAAIALLVLVVLIAIFSGRMRIVGGNVRSCSVQKGECKETCDDVFEVPYPGTDCADREDGLTTCCVPITN